MILEKNIEYTDKYDSVVKCKIVSFCKNGVDLVIRKYCKYEDFGKKTISIDSFNSFYKI